MELTNNLIKAIHMLSQKKRRDEDGCFVAEGTKCVLDTVEHFKCRHLFASKAWIDSHVAETRCFGFVEATRVQLDRMSMLKTPSDVLAVYDKPDWTLNADEIADSLTLVLDGVQDPGNLGTIMRIADWFGIRNIVCSEDTADVYNPKVVQATMGAIARVRVFYCGLDEFLSQFPDLPVYGTFLDGDDIYAAPLSEAGLLIMGNEGRGISPKVEQLVNRRLFIPPYPGGVATSESLNVGMATAIAVSEFRRRIR